jgi:hypothetical protein
MKCWLQAASGALVGALAACSASVSDTGYVGTWSRGNDRVRSTIAIAERDGTYLFRWGKESSDGRVKVRCDWDGNCVELSDGLEVARYHFRPWIDPASGRLRVECRGTIFTAEKPEVHYIDELEVRDDGKRLVAYTVERAGQQYSGRGRPRFKFTKVSDTVTDPPPAGARAGR